MVVVPMSKRTMDKRINVVGMQGNRNYLLDRGVRFEVHNPTISEVYSTIHQLASKRGKKPMEAINLLKKILISQLGV